MAFQSAMSKSLRGRVGSRAARRERISIKINHYGGKPRDTMVISVSEAVAREYRMRYGDRVEVLVDPTDAMILIRRLPSVAGGVCFCCAGKPTKNVAGEYGHGLVKFTPTDEVIRFVSKYEFTEIGNVGVSDLDVTDDGILVSLKHPSSNGASDGTSNGIQTRTTDRD